MAPFLCASPSLAPPPVSIADYTVPGERLFLLNPLLINGFRKSVRVRDVDVCVCYTIILLFIYPYVRILDNTQ